MKEGRIHRRPREVVLAARISFYRLEKNESGYETKVALKGVDAPEGHLEREVRRVIESDLPAELDAIYGIRVKARFITTRPGSVVAFFAVALEALGLFASYSDFFESISLVRKHSASLLERLMEDRYTPGPRLTSDVSVTIEYPRVPDPNDIYPGRWFRKRFDGPEADMFLAAGWAGHQPRARRDGLFWWLVICNLLLAIALIVLVAAAVVRTYFPQGPGLSGSPHNNPGVAAVPTGP